MVWVYLGPFNNLLYLLEQEKFHLGDQIQFPLNCGFGVLLGTCRARPALSRFVGGVLPIMHSGLV